MGAVLRIVTSVIARSLVRHVQAALLVAMREARSPNAAATPYLPAPRIRLVALLALILAELSTAIIQDISQARNKLAAL